MKYIILLIASMAVSGCAHQDPWSKRDTVMQVGVTLLMAADAVTTSRIQDHPNVEEAEFIARSMLGSQPTTSDTYIYFGTLAISNYFISRALPRKWRPYWQSANMAAHAYTVNKNCQLDLC